MIAWNVTYRRYRSTPSHKAENVVIVAAEGRLQELLDALHAEHPDAVIETADHLGPALVATPRGQSGGAS